MRKSGGRAATLACVVAAVLVAAPVVAYAAGGYKTGRYKGKTSQHQKLVFVLNHIGGCTAKTYTVLSWCLGTTTQAYVTIKCPDGQSTNNYIDIYGSLNRAGVIKAREVSTDGSVTQYYVKVSRNGTIKGWETFAQPESIGSTVNACKTGRISFTLHHV